MTRIGNKRIVSGDIGFNLCGPVGDAYFELAPGRVHENRLWLAVLSAMKGEATTIIDVGANVGFTTALAAVLLPHARIVAIEPSPTAFECLRRTIAANNFANVLPINACVSSSDGFVSFRERPGNLAGSGLAHDGERTVCRSLASIAKELDLRQIDLVKIDIEGRELDVIDGLDHAATAPLIVAEFSPLGIMGATRRLPVDFLSEIRARFGEIYYVGNSQTCLRVREGDDICELLAVNIQKDGGIGDLVFCSSRDRFIRVVSHEAIRSLPGPRALRKAIARTPRNLVRFFAGTLTG